MKWYKHMSDSLDNPFVFDLVDRFGGDGYLVFFGTLEVMSREFDINLPGTCTVSERFLTKKLQLSRQKMVKILKFLDKKGRILVTFKDGDIILNSPKLKELCDDFTKRKLRSEFVACSSQEEEEEGEGEGKEDKDLRPPPPDCQETSEPEDEVRIDEPEPDPEPGPEPEPEPEIVIPIIASCPHQGIISLYHEVLPELPVVQIWNDERAKLLKTRWREDPLRQDIAWWKNYFLQVKASPFLTGKEKPWRADLEWLIRPRNMPKVIEGRYEARSGRRLSGNNDIRPSTFHQAEKQSKSKLARMLLDGKIKRRNRGDRADDAQLSLP